jgi:hypothetical protein
MKENMFIHSIIRFSVEGHDHQTSEALVGMTRCCDPGWSLPRLQSTATRLCGEEPSKRHEGTSESRSEPRRVLPKEDYDGCL